MSKRDWGIGFASGLVVALAVTAIILASIWPLEQPIGYAAQGIEQSSEEQATELDKSNNDENALTYWVGKLFILEDTVAQWAMMGFTVLATLLLWRTLVLTNRTNQSAIDAATSAAEANEIMRTELRPWVVLRRSIGCDLKDRDIGASLRWKYNFENVGRSPAFNIRIELSFWKASDPVGPPGAYNQFIAESKIKAKHLNSTPILHPSERTNFILHEQYNFNTMYVGALMRNTDGTLTKTKVEGDTIGAFVCITYFLDSSCSDDSLAFDAETVFFHPNTDPEIPFSHQMLGWSMTRVIGTGAADDRDQG